MHDKFRTGSHSEFIYDMTIRSVRNILVPRHLSRPVAINGLGLPRYWAMVYEITSLSGHRDRTTERSLLAIDSFYRFVEDLNGADCLDVILHHADIDELSVLMEAFFLRERNIALQTGFDRHGRWLAVSKFVDAILDGIATSDRNLSKLKARIHRLGSKLTNLTPNPKYKKISVIRALPSTVVQDIYEIFDPAGARNPFRTETQRWRNFCLILVMLHQGLRRGEALLLPADAVKIGVDGNTLGTRLWMNIQNQFEDEDPRYCDPPSIKNIQSIRQIPVSRNVADQLQHFAMNYRGRSPYPHLFLNNRGKPLGSRSISNIMMVASEELSQDSRNALADNMRQPNFTAHDLRHTCAVVRLFHYRASGVSEEDALHKLRAFFGWTYDSSMPRLYARAYWERHVAEVWNDDFDSYVDAIRTIEHS